MPPLTPPFTLETAIAKVRLAEDGWNSRGSRLFQPSSPANGRRSWITG